jgi:hypothetical protein
LYDRILNSVEDSSKGREPLLAAFLRNRNRNRSETATIGNNRIVNSLTRNLFFLSDTLAEHRGMFCIGVVEQSLGFPWRKS